MSEDRKEAQRPEGEPEPSMEEILTSIRRIIASDEEESPTGGEGEEVLELTDVVEEGADEAAKAEERGKPEAAASDAPEPETSPPAGEETAAPPAEAEAKEEAEARETAPAAPAVEVGDLLSPAAAAATAAAFARVTRTVAKPDAEAEIPGGGRTVEEFLAELLRPMLREWLDAHLPALVERVVEREIRRLARRAEDML